MQWKQAGADRIYLPYQEGGEGFMSLEKEYKATTFYTQKYMTQTDNIQTRHYWNIRNLKLTTQYQRKLQISSVKQEQQMMWVKNRFTSKVTRNWWKKPGPGSQSIERSQSSLDNKYIDIEQSLQWMKHSKLKGKTEGLKI